MERRAWLYLLCKVKQSIEREADYRHCQAFIICDIVAATHIQRGGLMRRMAVGFFLVGLMLYILPQAQGQNLDYVGSTFWTEVNDVKVVGTYACCAYEGGVAIIDVSNPDSLVLCGKAFSPGNGIRLDISGGCAYLADRLGGLRVVDVTDSFNPSEISHYNDSSIVFDVAISGNYAYTATFYAGLQVIDITDPYHPALAAGVTLPDSNWAGRIAVEGEYAYVSTYYSGYGGYGYVYIFNISDPHQPVLSATIDNPYLHSGVSSIFIKEDYIYIATGDRSSYIVIFDISDPSFPTFASVTHTLGGLTDLFVEENYAFGVSISDLYVYDISNPYRLLYLVRFPLGRVDYPFSIHIGGNLAYIAAKQALEVVDISDPSDPVIRSTYQSGALDYRWQMTVSGDYAYIPSRQELYIFDVSDRSNPIEIDRLNFPYRIERIIISSNYAYISGSGILWIVDVSDPRSPTIEGSYIPQSSTAKIIAASGNYAYLETGLGLEIVNIEDPANPTLAGEYWRLGRTFVSGSYAYMTITNADEFQVIDISDLANPALVGSLSINASRVFVQGDYAYLWGHNENGPAILSVDISNPSSPRLIGSCNLNWITVLLDYYVSGNYLYICESDQRYNSISRNGVIDIIDISDPTNPTLISDFRLAGDPGGIYVDGDYCYINSEYAFVITTASPTAIDDSHIIPFSSSLSQNYPNPFNARTTISYSVAQAGPVSLEIYNILGEKVAVLQDGLRQAGYHQITWDAKDMPSGVYFAKLNADKKAQTIKMVVLK